MRQTKNNLSLILGLVILLSSCLPNNTENQAADQGLAPDTPNPTAAVDIHPTPTDEPPGEINPLSPQPLDLVFFSEDGFEIQGRFFPAATLDRPVLVLMHWYPGDQYEWEEIAFWLQNRGSGGQGGGVPWLDPSWFPGLPSGTSYNVLTFTFRECEGGCKGLSPQAWLKDAQASLKAARALQGVDPDQVVAIGASIGGDAAISSCASALENDPNTCLGTLSLSPGSYLDEAYPDQVARLENSLPPRPAWCLFDESDPDAAVCLKASGDHYYREGWQGGNLHGMHLLTSTLDPLPLQRLVDFLDLVLDN